MKLAFSTLGCPDWSFEQVVENARAMGYQGIELRGIQGEMRATELRSLLAEDRLKSLSGLRLCSFGSSAFFQEEGMEAALAEGRAAIELCARAHIPYVRVFGGRPAEGGSLKEQTRFVAEGVRALCREAKQTGVSILLEVHGWYQTAERILVVAEQVSEESFGIIWDVEHSDEADGGDFLSFYMPTRSLIRHVHLKDHKRLPDGTLRLCSVGEGDIPLRAMIERLEADGYDGYYSLEWEKKWHPELPEPEEEFPAFVRYMRKR